MLGATGGTVFERLFGMQRAKHPSDVWEVVKIIMRPDKQRRVLICRREDGRFSFVEERAPEGPGRRAALADVYVFRSGCATLLRPPSRPPARRSGGWV